jgi:hypothetical protein
MRTQHDRHSRSPEIRTADARYARATRPGRHSADPMVGLGYHNERSDRITFGSSDFSFVKLTAEQPIPFPGKPKSAIAELEANRERAMQDAML